MTEYERVPIDQLIGKYDLAGIHWAAELFPMMTDEEFQALCIDADAQGFVSTVKVDDDGLLIDGRNRLQAGYAIGKDPTIVRHQPSDTLAWVLAENLHRRHLTTGQRAFVAREIATIPQGGDRRSADQKQISAFDREEAAAKVGTTPWAITQTRTISEFAPELEAGVRAGALALETAYHAAKKRKEAAKRQEDPGPAAKPGAVMLDLPAIIKNTLTTVQYPKPKGRHQFNETNEQVGWADWTWNPVTGCLHGCTYCYAREMAYRPSYARPYPIQFEPLFHTERLDDPINTATRIDPARPQSGRVFVCSMSDLFGEWVPIEWVDAVFEAALAAPEWEYLFLTKFPQRYRRINLPPRAWFGTTVDTQARVRTAEKAMPQLDVAVRWLSIEPLLEPIKFNDLSWCDLMVIGAQSETVQPPPVGLVPAFAPDFHWVMDLVVQATDAGVPVYLKPNLLGETNGVKPGMVLPQGMPRLRER